MSPLFSVRARTVDHLLSPVARQPSGIGHHIVTFDVVDFFYHTLLIKSYSTPFQVGRGVTLSFHTVFPGHRT